MNQRERFLAICIGAIGILFVGRYFWMSSQAALESKSDEVARLTSQLEDQELAILAGNKAGQRITKVTPRAASVNPERAQADYEKWLIQVSQEVNLADAKYTKTPPTKGKDKFTRYGFTVAGQGDLATVTRLLYKFYTKPFLHRVKKLSIQNASNRPEDKGKLNISIDSEYLAIPSSKALPVSSPYDPSLLASTLEDYESKVVVRNIFSEPNKAPTLVANSHVPTNLGANLDHTVVAKDPDANQSITYTIEGDAPSGMKIDGKSGKLSWVGKELGDYKVTIRATDSGLPAKSATQVLTITVVPAPPPPLEPEKFNIASQAKLTGLVSGRQGAEAWIHSLTEGKTLKLQQGDEMVLGDLKGKVIAVGVNYVEIETQGKKWTLGIDEAVLDAYKRGTVD